MGERGLLQEDAKAIALNQALIDELKKKECIRSESTEAAFRAVLRHEFLPGTPLEVVYSDQAISAKQDPNGQWLSSSSQPAIMAIMLEQLVWSPVTMSLKSAPELDTTLR